MTEANEQTIVISDLLSFLGCKVKLVSKEKLLRTIKNYYSEKEISEAYKILFTTLSEIKISQYCDNYINLEPLNALYNCILAIPPDALPVFVCKNLNNVPELDITDIIKIEQHIPDEIDDDDDDDDDLDDNKFGVEKTLREEQKTMKLQIADIALVVRQLKDQLDNISHQNQYQSKDNAKMLKRKGYTNVFPNKKKCLEIKTFNLRNRGNLNYRKRNLKYIQKLMNEDEEIINKDQQNGNDHDSDNQDCDDTGHSDYEELPQQKKEDICEVILKEVLEDGDFPFNKIREKKENDIYLVSPSKSDQLEKYFGGEGSLRKPITQKIIYIKNNDEDILEEEENSIEITSSSDYLGNLAVDPANGVDSIDSVKVTSKQTPSESKSIIIEKIIATNGKGYYYKCQQCEFICNEEKMILKHECNAVTVDAPHRKPRRINKYAESNVFMCTLCETYVVDVVEFNEHMLDHYKIMHGDGDYECVLCALKTDNYENYKLHLVEHNWKVPYSCELCDYRSTKEIRMRNHAVKHLECKGPNHFECLICRKICGTRNALEKHKQRHKKNYDFKCEICGLTFRHRSALSQHTMNHTNERIYVCQICNYRYDSQHSLNVHVKVHFKDNLFACHICNQKFKSKNTYRNHVLSAHEGVKPFKCELCDEAFIFKHTMLMHRKSHGSQLYVCTICSKKFKSPHYLKVHYAMHEGKNPFKCPSCEFTSPSKAILKKHLSGHVETLNLNLLSCGNCNYVTVYSNEMEKHNRLHHADMYDDNKVVMLVDTPQ